MWNEMKEKWTNKEAKVWFMEAQKWTQQCKLLAISLIFYFESLILVAVSLYCEN
jgi:hypothetical protein